MRILVKAIAGAFGTAVGGPALGYALWKGAGVAMGNPASLLPGGSLTDLGLDALDLADGTDVYGNPPGDVYGNPPSDVHGNPLGRNGHGNLPGDIHGKPRWS